MVGYTLFLIPIAIAIFLAFNMGGSGTSPAYSASYGANLIRRELIPGLFGAFVLLGALIAGSKVVKTIGGDILPSESMSLVIVSIILLASALSIFIANILKVPQSTSQSTIFSLAGCALYLGNLQTGKLFFEIIPTWLITPLISFVITYLVGGMLIKWQQKKKLADYKVLSEKPVWKYITIGCSCYVAFAIGSNNVANSAGPITSMLINTADFQLADTEAVFALISILLVAPWFGIGSSFLGKRVLDTTGEGITRLGPISATLIAVITATLLLMASTLRGIPTSLVQMNTFSIIALSIVENGPKDVLSKQVLLKVFTVWLVAPVVAFIISYSLMIAAESLNLI